jgi:hypothetical protein
MKKLTSKMLEGKYIEHVMINGVNSVDLSFGDGTRLSLNVEAIEPGLYGLVAEERIPDDSPSPTPVNKKFLVRQNCEFSILLDAVDEDDAIEKARDIDIGDIGWDKAWGNFEAEEHDG